MDKSNCENFFLLFGGEIKKAVCLSSLGFIGLFRVGLVCRKPQGCNLTVSFTVTMDGIGIDSWNS